MRVITGSARGRRLKELEGMETRPTTDRVKEGLFNVLQFDIEGRRVLDLFAGTGQLGIECLSRGAASAVFVDKRPDAVKLIRENLKLCDLTDRARVVAGDSMEFLKSVREKFDLVLLDVMLPGVDGFALMDYIAPTGTPVIFLTAKNAVADRVRGLKLGAYDYIVKPFAPAELLARVEGLLRHTGRRAATLRVFDAEVDPDNRTVTQNGRAVELTPREFTLLLVLVRARGQALYRDILYERVWGPDAEPNPRALDLHIHRLRKKLDWADKIVTVPKVGYKLLAER